MIRSYPYGNWDSLWKDEFFFLIPNFSSFVCCGWCHPISNFNALMSPLHKIHCDRMSFTPLAFSSRLHSSCSELLTISVLEN